MPGRLFTDLTPLERKTFRLHFIYASLDGLVLGLFVLNEFVFLKSLRGSSFSIGVLFQLTVVMLFFLLFFNEYVRRAQNKKLILRWVAVITRLPLFGMAFFPGSIDHISHLPAWHILFLGIFLMYYLADPVMFPAINLFLKSNYRHGRFGVLYSYASASNKVLTVLATFLYGLFLDADPFAFRYIYPVAGAMGLTAIFLFSTIPYNAGTNVAVKKGFWQSVTGSVSNMVLILRQNSPYRHYQIAFMLYGIAYMMIYPVVTIFYEKELHLSYSSVAFYKNVFSVLAVVLIPFFGRRIGSIDPRRFTSYNYAFMAVYIFFTGLTQFFPWKVEVMGITVYYLLFTGVLFNGVFTAMMALSWYIGSAYFSSAHEAGDYQAVHLSLTGLRGIFAPLAGVMFYEMAGFPATFLLAILFLAWAIWVNEASMTRYPVIYVEKK